MDNKIEPSKMSNIIAFSLVVLTSTLIMWIFVCIAAELHTIPRKQLPESLLYPLSFIFYPMFFYSIVGRCLKTMPLGKYTEKLGIFIIILLVLFSTIYIGILDFTFIPGILLK